MVNGARGRSVNGVGLHRRDRERRVAQPAGERLGLGARPAARPRSRRRRPRDAARSRDRSRGPRRAARRRARRATARNVWSCASELGLEVAPLPGAERACVRVRAARPCAPRRSARARPTRPDRARTRATAPARSPNRRAGRGCGDPPAPRRASCRARAGLSSASRIAFGVISWNTIRRTGHLRLRAPRARASRSPRPRGPRRSRG